MKREVVLPGGTSLSGGEIVTDGLYLIAVTDTALQLLSGSSGGGGVPTGGTIGQVLKKNSSTDYDTSWQDESGGGGGGDMTKSVYDPAGKNADAFDYNNFINTPTIPTIDPNTTIQGNTFNGADQLVKLDGSGKLPAIDGSLLTGLPTEIIWLTDESFLPTVGVTDKAYVSKATGIIYLYDTVSGSYKIVGGGEGTPYMTATGTNTYIVTNTPAVTSYPLQVIVNFTNGNTGDSTIKFDALAALPIKMDGFTLVEKNISPGSRKVLILAPDSSHYQLQSANLIPPVASGERVMTVLPSGLSTATKVINPLSETSTTGANLEAQTWVANTPVTYLGEPGEVRYWNNYKYECTAPNTWWRVFYNMIINDVIIGAVDDSAGKKTSGQMADLYPNAIPFQIVWGTAGTYQYMSSLTGWAYYENKI